MQIEPPDRQPASERGLGPGELAAVLLVLCLAVFAVAFAPTPGNDERADGKRLACMYRTKMQQQEAVNVVAVRPGAACSSVPEEQSVPAQARPAKLESCRKAVSANRDLPRLKLNDAISTPGGPLPDDSYAAPAVIDQPAKSAART